MNQLCVVIAFKNSCEYRLRNLSFLKNCLSGESLDVIICEETEGDSISEFQQENIRTIQVPAKKDFNKSRLYNIACEDIDCDYILFLDADVFLNFKEILEALKSYKGELAKPFDRTFLLGPDLTEKFLNLELEPEDLVNSNYCSFWGKHAVLISKCLLEEKGGFDESFEGWGWEDLDFVNNQLRGHEPDVFNFTGLHLHHTPAKKHLERKNYFLYKNKLNNGLKKISFCTGVKNRLSQLKKTLFENLESNLENSKDIEFILVDFDSNDGCSEWVIENCQNYLSSGFLKFFKIINFPYWHASICKNTCHLLGEGEVLVNLDCDNFTGIRGGDKLINIFKNQDIKLVHQWCRKEWFSGNYGRIGVRRGLFDKLGGYDESLHNMAYQDTDLIERSKLIFQEGVFNFPHPNYNEAIKNEKEESIKNIPQELKDRGFDWLHNQNKSTSEENISKYKSTANEGQNLHLYEKILAYDPASSKFVRLCS